MPDFVIPVSQVLKGDRIILEADMDVLRPITPISRYVIVLRAPTSPPNTLLRLRSLTESVFFWLDQAGRAVYKLDAHGGKIYTSTRKPAGYEFDVIGSLGETSEWIIVYQMTKAPYWSMVTGGFYLADWPLPILPE